MALEALGIDPRVAAVLEASGIRDLYPPQKEAWAAIKTGQNALIAIPTASGKSLLAYLGILHRWLATGKKALYIVPLRALASEKHEELQQFKSLGLTVGLSTGDLDERDPRLGRFDVIVCTSEKADALLRHRAGWIDDVGCVVADELHLMNDPGRGPTLEVILTRFRAVIPTAQVIGLSATVQNSKAVAAWLGAKLITSQWRPVTLSIGTYTGNRLEFLDKPVRILDAGGDPVASLAEETIRDGGQCLVFVSTRKSAEAQATRLAGTVRELLRPDELAYLAEAAASLDDGSGEGSPTAKKLQKLATAGVAYHTAGLDGAQRRWVEAQFRAGKLKVLCATPTLAAGVNTPARRVIIRDVNRFEAGYGNRPLPVMEVKQMMGRAGRPRYDPYGEAVLLAKSPEMKEQLEETYLRGDVEPVTSKLPGEAALRTHVLSSIAGGYCDTLASLELFFARTFWAHETSAWIVRERLEDVLDFLQTNDFVDPDGSRIKATPFGKRTSDLYLDPFSALRLRAAVENKVGAPTPFALLQAVCGCPDLFPLYLRQSDDWVQQRFWDYHEEMLIESDGRDLEEALSYAKTAFLLSDWMEEVHLDLLEERYQIGPGDIRMRLDNAKWLLHGMHELSRGMRPEWSNTIRDLGIRLEHGVKEELLPMIQLKGVGRVRARTLRANGFRKPADLKAAPLSRLLQLPGFGPRLAADLLRQVGGDPEGESPVPEASPPAKGKGQSTMADYGARP